MGAIASQEKPSLHNTQDRLGLGPFSNYCDMVLKSQKNSHNARQGYSDQETLSISVMSFFFISGSKVTANVITSPSENANELYTEVEEDREYEEIPTRETYPERQNENSLYESAAYEMVSFI